MRLFADFDAVQLPAATGANAAQRQGRRVARRNTAQQQMQPQARPAAPPQARKPGRVVGYGPAARIQVTTTDEDRTKLILASAVTPGNGGVTAFSGQTAAQHPLLCVAVLVQWRFANNPAGTIANPVFLNFTANPTIKGRPILDGDLSLAIGEEELIILQRPVKILESTSLQHGTAACNGGAATMSYKTRITYMTDLELQLYLSRNGIGMRF